MPLDVPAFDQRLDLSGVVLAAIRAHGSLTLREDERMKALIGASPTASRRFRTDDRILAYAEVYSDDRSTTTADVRVSGIVTSASGTEVKREDGLLRAVDDARGGAGGWGATMELSLADLAPGEYVLILEAASARRKSPVQRRIPFVVEEPAVVQ